MPDTHTPAVTGSTKPPLAPGRYCLRTCYCGECPQYQPLTRATTDAPAPAAPQNTSWDQREEPTWIDGL